MASVTLRGTRIRITVKTALVSSFFLPLSTEAVKKHTSVPVTPKNTSQEEVFHKLGAVAHTVNQCDFFFNFWCEGFCYFLQSHGLLFMLFAPKTCTSFNNLF